MVFSTELIAVFLLAFAALVSANPCPDETWRYSPHSHKCYKLYNQKTGWVISEFKCAFQGSHHVSIHDPIENQFVSELARQADVIWLGIAQFGTSQDYVWSDHAAFNFEQWHAKHNYRKPTYHKGKKCAKLDSVTKTWMQSCCKVPAAFICEKPANGPRNYQAPPVTTPQTTAPTTPWWLNSENTANSNTNEIRRFRFRRL
jgi:hypothetical protein